MMICSSANILFKQHYLQTHLAVVIAPTSVSEYSDILHSNKLRCTCWRHSLRQWLTACAGLVNTCHVSIDVSFQTCQWKFRDWRLQNTLELQWRSEPIIAITNNAPSQLRSLTIYQPPSFLRPLHPHSHLPSEVGHENAIESDYQLMHIGSISSTHQCVGLESMMLMYMLHNVLHASPLLLVWITTEQFMS